MSVWATKWAYEQTIKPVGRKFVLIAIADFADETGWCFPSQETLASMTDQGVSTVRAHIKKLEADGLVKREARYAPQGGGRKSDGFWLQAPKESLKPPPKSKPPKAGGKVKQTAKTEIAYRQVTGNLPPEFGGDPIGTTKEPPKESSPHSQLMKIHSDRLGQNIPDPRAQAGAVKWIIERFPTTKAVECYKAQLGEPWRKGHVSWLTVKQRIAEFVKPPAYVPQEKIVADHGDWYEVEACQGGGTSPRYRTAEAFARLTGRDLETVRAGWN